MLYKFVHTDTTVHIRPTHLIFCDNYENIGDSKRIQNRFKFEDNKVKGKLSNESNKKIRNSVNWLINSAKSKTLKKGANEKKYSWKINLITLTVPPNDKGYNDDFYKKKILHNFLNTSKYKFKLRNYIWKSEAQGNSMIHFHITTDTYFNKDDLRSCWNSILRKQGILSGYKEKFSNMSLSDYTKLMVSYGYTSAIKIKRAYQSGVLTKWENPNTTDVHSVKNVEKLGSYLCEYLKKNKRRGKSIDLKKYGVKNDCEIEINYYLIDKNGIEKKVCKKVVPIVSSCRRKIEGRIWGSNYAISKANKLKISYDANEADMYYKYLKESGFESKDLIIGKTEISEGYKIGKIVYLKDDDILYQEEKLKEAYYNTLQSIRFNAAVTGQLLIKEI